jgi:hypothetical protein
VSNAVEFIGRDTWADGLPDSLHCLGCDAARLANEFNGVGVIHVAAVVRRGSRAAYVLGSRDAHRNRSRRCQLPGNEVTGSIARHRVESTERGETHMAGDREQTWWYNHKTGEVEEGPQSLGSDRDGPYVSREEAARAPEIARERARRWAEEEAEGR